MLKLGDAAMHPKEIFKETQASKLGDAPSASPSPSTIISSSFAPLYFYHFMHYVLCLERLALSYLFSFLELCLLFITSYNPDYFVLERNTLHLKLEHIIRFSCLSFFCCV